MTRMMLPGVVPGISVDAAIDKFFRDRGLHRPGSDGPGGTRSANGWSRIGEFCSCPYRYYLRHVRKVRVDPAVAPPIPKPYLDIGSLGHVCLALHYAPLLPEGYPGWQANMPTPEELLAGVVEINPAIAQFAPEVEGLVDRYRSRWADEIVSPVALEYEAGDARFHTSRYDMVAWIEDGIHDGLWIFEHKFLSTRSQLEAFQLDGEVLGEMLSWRVSKLDTVFQGTLAGVCLNVVFKTSPTATTLVPPQRLWIPVMDEKVNAFSLSRAYWSQWCMGLLNANEAAARRGEEPYWPRNYVSCSIKYGLCSFWSHCCDGAAVIPVVE